MCTRVYGGREGSAAKAAGYTAAYAAATLHYGSYQCRIVADATLYLTATNVGRQIFNSLQFSTL